MLTLTYPEIRKSVVAFAQTYEPIWSEEQRPSQFPHIVGTGFVVREDGLIATNDHVVKAFTRTPRPPNAPSSDWGVYALMFHLAPRGQLEVPLELLGVFRISNFVPGPAYYGPERPDLALVQVNARGLSPLRLSANAPAEGTLVATTGFPMGTQALMAPGYLHQVSPTLQTGVVSALLPFPSKSPHAYTVNLMTQGGASGSPVFYPDSGDVIGVLYGGLFDLAMTKNEDVHRVPTNISYVVPSRVLMRLLEEAERHPSLRAPADAKTIEERIRTEEVVNVLEKGRLPQILRVREEEVARPEVKELEPEAASDEHEE